MHICTLHMILTALQVVQLLTCAMQEVMGCVEAHSLYQLYF